MADGPVKSFVEALDVGSVVLTQRILNEPTPATRYVWEDLMIAGEAGACVGAGGVGKTNILCGLAVAIASGLGEFLGKPCEEGCVAIISGEDGAQSYTRWLKGWCIFLGVEHEEIASRIRVYPLPDIMPIGDSQKLITYSRQGIVVNAPLVQGLIDSLNQGGALNSEHSGADADDEPVPSYARDPLRLVILETASTLSVGNETNDAMGALVSALSALARGVTSRPAVAITHHTTGEKATKKDPLGALAGRGGSAFSFNTRWGLSLGYEKGSLGPVLRCQKLRDGNPKSVAPIELAFIEVSVDGNPVGVLAPAGEAPKQPAAQPARPAGRVNGTGEPPEPGNGAARPVGRPPTSKARRITATRAIVKRVADAPEGLTKRQITTDAAVTTALGRNLARVLVDRLVEKGYLAPTGGVRGPGALLGLGPNIESLSTFLGNLTAPEIE